MMKKICLTLSFVMAMNLVSPNSHGMFSKDYKMRQQTQALKNMFVFPKDPETGKLFNENSDADRACQLLGFERAIPNTKINLDPNYFHLQDTILINARGAGTVIEGLGIWRLSCGKKRHARAKDAFGN